MLWAHPDRARTALSPIASRCRPRPPPSAPASARERGGGIGARLRHRVRAALQGKHDGRVRG
eukprot:4930235-Prymnesium_polylepis.1